MGNRACMAASGLRIYIAEDIKETADLIESILSEALCSFGKNVFCTVKNGKELLEMLRLDGNPDVLLLDGKMAPMDGFDVLKHIRKNRHVHDFPTVVVTAVTESTIIRELYKLGASDVVPKPFLAADLADRVVRVVERQRERERSEHNAWIAITRLIEAKDDSTGQHLDRIARLTFLVAQEIGMNDSECVILMRASGLHDIGKVAVPDKILQKQGPLTGEEWEVMKGHAEEGFKIIKDCEGAVFSHAKDIVLFHHEKLDGSGYPQGLSGGHIPISARIVAVVDAYDAMRSRRPYKKPMTREDTVREIFGYRDKWYDSGVVDCFVSVLNNGEVE